jgi:hypothetical protein
MPAKSIGERAMTDAERQARYRAARASGAPVIRTRRPADHRSRARRWDDTIAELTKLQAEYDAWLQSLPENLQDTRDRRSLARDQRTRPQRASGDRAAARLRPGLNAR